MTRYILILLLWLPVLAVHAADLQTFCRYSSKDGLCCNYVHNIVQDKHGFLWIATEYGVSRFDGVHFRNYYVEDCPSLLRNQIMNAYVTDKGELLLGGNNGVLLSYDEETDTFTDLMPDDFHDSYFKGITRFYTDTDGKVWISTSNGLYVYKEEQKKFGKEPCITDSTNFAFISSFVKDRFGRFFCGSFSGLYVFDADGRHITEFDNRLQLGTMVSSIIEINPSQLLVSSFIGGIWIVDIGEDGDVSAPVVVNAPFKNVNAVIRDSNRRFWFGTAGSGLWSATYDGKFHFEKENVQKSRVEELQKIHCLYEDKDGDIWVGTQNAGVLRYDARRSGGVVHSSDVEFPIVDGTSFAEDESGEILVAADGHGLFLLSPDYQIIERFTIEDGLSTNNVLCVRKGIDGKYWIAMWGGDLCQLDLKNRKITRCPYDGIHSVFSTSKVVLPCANGEVWVSTSGDGVYAMDKDGHWTKMRLDANGTFSDPDVWIEDVTESPTGVRWIVSSRTVWRCEGQEVISVFPDADGVPQHNPNIMLQGVCDKSGNLFVVSTQGVLRFSADGKHYEWLRFLPEGQYSSIVMDADGNFWTAGSNGIVSFNYEQSTYRIISVDEQYRSRNFYTCRASFIDSKGMIYFGSTEGFIAFDPKKVGATDALGYLAFSSLYVKDKLQKVGSPLLPERLSKLSELRLNYDETSISIWVDVVDFSGLNNVEISYRLAGLESDWHFIDNKREIAFSHIPPGSYTLEVEARRRGVEKNVETLTLKVVVLPPWWKTWWFYSISLFLVLGITALILFYRFRHIMAQRELLRQKVEERTKELNDANVLLEQKKEELEEKNGDLELTLREKNRLISVIAHDLKNPMFAIVGTLDGLLKRKPVMDESSMKTLRGVYLSAFNLQSVLLKLLEWARGKRQDVACQLGAESVRSLVGEVVSLLDANFSQKKITVALTDNQLTHCALMDGRMIGTALRNILTNAVKFSPQGGKIEVETFEEVGMVGVRIRDYGVGMSAEQLESLEKGNVVSSLGTNREAGTGLGLQLAKEYIDQSGGQLKIQSGVGIGTTMTILLPVADEVDRNDLQTQPATDDKELTINADLVNDNTVLLVEDDDMLRAHIKAVLSAYFKVIEASDGDDGFRTALSETPDIILSDVEMPICDGIEMYGKMKENPRTSHIPLVFLSARTSEDERLAGLRQGAIDYMTKPFSDKELLMKLSNILLFRRQQQQTLLKNYQEGDHQRHMETNPLLQSVLDLVEEHYSESDFSAENICEALSMSKSSFARKLKSITDKTPTEILTECRLYKAKELLRKGGKTVAEVAYSVGFNDPLYFSRKFKTFFGYSPSMSK